MKHIIPFILLSISFANAQPNWNLLPSRVPGSIQGIASLSDGTLFVASYFGGTFRSIDNGRSWDKMDIFPIEVFDIVSTIRDTVIVGLAASANLYITTDRGVSWFPVGGNTARCYKLSIGNTDEIYSGTSNDGVFRSTNGGIIWESAGLKSLPEIRILCVDANGNVYAGNNRNIYRSTDSGGSWVSLNSNFPDYQFLSISASPSGNVYIGAYRSLDGNVFISTDRGETWTKRQFLNIDAKVVGVVEMSNGDLIAATENAMIWRSTDGGVNWSGFIDGFLHDGVTCLYQARNGRVFAGAGGAIYELMGYPVSTEDTPAPSSLSLAQSYPNPVVKGQGAYINFSLPTQEYITLTVYSTSGQEVAQIAQGTFPPGTHTAMFNSGNLPTGVYIYRLVAGGRQESRVLQVLR